MLQFSVINPGWLKRLVILSAMILGQRIAFGQIPGKSKENHLKPEAVAQLRDFYKTKIEAYKKQGSASEADQLEFAANYLMLAEAAELPEEAYRWQRELYLNHTNTVQAIFFRRRDGWEGVTAFIEKEYCDFTCELDNDKIGKLGQLFESMSKEHPAPPSFKETLLGYILLAESRPQIISTIKSKDPNSSKDDEWNALRIIIANDNSPEKQIIGLDKITNSRIVDRYKLYLFENKISDTDRAKKIVGISAARAYRRQGQPAKAEEAMGKIQGSEKLLEYALLRAYSESLKGNKTSTISALDQFIATNPTEADKKKARDVQSLLSRHFANTGKLNSHFQNTAITITLKKPEGFLIRAYETNKNDGLEGFLRFDKTEEAYEVVLLKDKKVIFALKASDEGTATYLPGGNSIKKMPTRIWSPTLAIDSDEITDFRFQLGTASNSENTLGDVWKKLLGVVEKYAAKGPNFEELLKHSDFLIGQIGQDGHSFELRSFDGTEKSIILRLATDKEKLPSRVEWSHFALEFVTWDVAEAKKTIGALWPKVKDQVISEINVGEYVSVFGQLMTYLQEATNEKPAEGKPAGEK